MEKKAFLIIFAGIFLLSLNLIAAINIETKITPITEGTILDLNEPAVFDLTIKNLGVDNNFSIYTTVGIDISPKEPIFIKNNEEKTIRIEVMPQESFKSKKGLPNFEYKIKNSNNEVYVGTLSVNIMELRDVFVITPDTINIKSDKIKILIKNRDNLSFDDLKVNMGSVFFDYSLDIPIKGLETKEIEIPLDKEKLSTLSAGNYLLETEIVTRGEKFTVESMIKFTEQEGIETTESVSGFFIKSYEVTKRNVGNTKQIVSVKVKKNLVSYLFTTFNPNPTKIETIGLAREYTWEKELIPSDEFKVSVKTNWFYPLIILILIIAAIYFIRRSVEGELSFKKKVGFVKTKGGQFALRVRLVIKSKKFIEKIKVVDRLPHLVNLYEKYGAIAPDRVDLKNKRIEWDIEALNEGEERIFSYIIYSKVGVVGKFELPSAMMTYEKDGKIKEATSNRSFYVNEPQKNDED
jgi:hypothetical protein